MILIAANCIKASSLERITTIAPRTPPSRAVSTDLTRSRKQRPTARQSAATHDHTSDNMFEDSFVCFADASLSQALHMQRTTARGLRLHSHLFLSRAAEKSHLRGGPIADPSCKDTIWRLCHGTAKLVQSLHRTSAHAKRCAHPKREATGATSGKRALFSESVKLVTLDKNYDRVKALLWDAPLDRVHLFALRRRCLAVRRVGPTLLRCLPHAPATSRLTCPFSLASLSIVPLCCPYARRPHCRATLNLLSPRSCWSTHTSRL